MTKDILTVKEAAEYLGIKETALRVMMCENKIAYYKTKYRRVYFDIKDLRNYALGTRVPSKDELMAKAELASLNN